jgi:hypothetical protein
VMWLEQRRGCFSAKSRGIRIAYANGLEEQAPAIKLTRTDAVRAILLRGLK